MRNNKLRSNLGLLLIAVIMMSSLNSTFASIENHSKYTKESNAIKVLGVDPRNTPDMINKAKDAVDAYIKIREA